MNGLLPPEHRGQTLADLQSHGRCLAVELKSLNIPYDTIVDTDESAALIEGWEIPAYEVPADRPLMLGQEGIYISKEPRMPGRKARLISEGEVAAHGAALALRQRLHALEKRHNVFEKIRKGSTAE